MTDDDAARLRALASAASVGPWSVQGNNLDEWYVYALHARYETLPGNPSPVKVAWVPWSPGTLRHEHDAAYIAAASPDAILALLDERDALRRERDEAQRDARELRFLWEQRGERANKAEDERDAAVALLREARYFVESDVAMMDAISRHSPLPHDEQARHDATEYPSERLLKRIDALLGDGEGA